jgi:cellobiose phosphorylase
MWSVAGNADPSSILNHQDLSKSYQKERSAMIQRVELAGWGGEWYLRGTFDDGSPLGSAINKEARIESLPQSRAWISGAADPGRTDQALESVWNYKIEPYVVAADVYRLPGWIGQSGWSWYTGSAAWMYRAWIEEVLGLQIHGGQMRVNPDIPAAWQSFSLRYRHAEAVYAIQVENPHSCQSGVAWMDMDGKRVSGGIITLEHGLVKHQVVVMMGNPE